MTLLRSGRVAVVLLWLVATTSGCQSWRSGGVPGVSGWGGDRSIAKLARNDPFPSPEQVGLKPLEEER